MAITSQLRPVGTPGDMWIADWRAANLLKPSAIKPVFATIEQALVIRKLGLLSAGDQSLLRAAIASVLG
jgi:mRNA interferase MazF